MQKHMSGRNKLVFGEEISAQLFAKSHLLLWLSLTLNLSIPWPMAYHMIYDDGMKNTYRPCVL